ncbi:tetratricopeptide repeat protein [Desmospora activa]|uniref:Tetratricopeptide repeat protein n=1 Tax=Desmospora activa DSM 45169 TaxID=1121389 RepID=A0A2T4Z4K5_9BACL|nr:tetratricopeptide repeat protein [Desmospora activa]PTM56834.1 tetratricopeptide repeat protein [Desmospora activa DSM 45169]
MKTYQLHDIGEIIRKVRKQRGFRLEDLADDNISVATISNIERNVPHVSTDKVLYLLEKLNLSLDSLPRFMLEKKGELKALNFKLLGAESLFSNGKWEKALDILDSFELDDSHSLAAKVYYLKGKCFIKADKWKKAERNLFKAIQLASQQEDRDNIEAASFNELAIICYFHNDLDKAIQFVTSGLDAFETNGKQGSLFWLLNMNKALFFERLGKLSDSMNIVLEVWESLETIDESDTVLIFYWLRTELLRRMGELKGSEKYALAGIDIARRNSDFNQLFELWVVLGCTYVDQEKYEDAEFSFEQALTLDGPKEHKLITAYAWLGKLYVLQKKWDQALPALENALSLGKKHNDISRYGQALQYMGDYFREKGEPDKAIVYYQESLELAQNHNMKKKEYIALFRLAQCWEGVSKEEFQQATVEAISQIIKMQTRS